MSIHVKLHSNKNYLFDFESKCLYAEKSLKLVALIVPVIPVVYTYAYAYASLFKVSWMHFQSSNENRHRIHIKYALTIKIQLIYWLAFSTINKNDNIRTEYVEAYHCKTGVYIVSFSINWDDLNWENRTRDTISHLQTVFIKFSICYGHYINFVDWKIAKNHLIKESNG